jgi:hypothetical protein
MVRTVLYILDPRRYFEGIIGIFKKDLNEQNVIYVSTNKPYDHIVSLFHDEDIDTSKIFFIDCISKEVGSSTASKECINCMLVESPRDITGLSIAINAAIDNISGDKLLLLDSLSTMLIYNDSKVVGKFSNFLINRLRVKGVSGIILAIESDVDKDIIQSIESFVDEVKQNG